MGNYEMKVPWKWEDMCGPAGLYVWDDVNKDFGVCFEQLFVQLPVLLALAAASAYYMGYRADWVLRDKWQERAISLRSLSVLALACVPAARLYTALGADATLHSVDYLSAGMACVSWLVHFGYLLALKRRLGPSARGPLCVLVCWALALGGCAVAVRSRALLALPVGFDVATLCCHLVYLLSLLPSSTSRPTFYSSCLVGSQHAHSEYTPLLPRVEEEALGVAMQDSGPLSRLLFSWVNPLFHKGSQNKLRDPEDLFDVPSASRCTRVGARLERALVGCERQHYEQRPHQPFMASHGYGASRTTERRVAVRPARRHTVTLVRALHACFGLRFYSVGVLKLVADSAGFAGPMLLGALVAFVEDQSEDVHLGYLYAAGLLASTATAALFTAHFDWQMALLALQMRGALVATLLRKSLAVAAPELSRAFALGEVTNFMSTDTDRIVNFCPSFHAVWSIPLQLVVTLFLMYRQVGVSFLAGVGFSLLLVPVNKLVADRIGRVSEELMRRKDARVSLVGDMLRGMSTIKLHVWEEYFVGRISSERAGELRQLRVRKYLDAVCVVLWATTPVLVAALTLGVHAWRGAALTAATVFTTVALVNMLIAPLNAFPWVLNGLAEAWVSVRRIQRLLQLPDMDAEQHYDTLNTNRDEDKVIVLRGTTFRWPGAGEAAAFALTDLELQVTAGQLVAVTGAVGSGKSSLLRALLGDLRKTRGELQVPERLRESAAFGYAAQRPWLVQGTVRENILFGRPYDEARFRAVLDACALTEELDAMGWNASVGEDGCKLSGGQRARLALARTVYQECAVYLLDDVLAGLDARVAQHVLQRCVLGLLHGRTRILVTHAHQPLTHAHHVLVLADGKILRQGSPEAVLNDLEEMPSVAATLGEEPPCPPEAPGRAGPLDRSGSTDENLLAEEEAMAEGSVGWAVTGMYVRAAGALLAGAILVSVVLMQASQNATFLWLSVWVRSQGRGNATDDGHFHLYVYAGLAALNLVLTTVRAFLFAYGGVVAAARLHEALLGAIARARIEFMDRTPTGRLLNRFSSDTYAVDDSLPFILNILLAQSFSLLGALAVAMYGLPWLGALVLPLLVPCYWLQRRYRRTSRQLKRLQSVALSPLYSHFNDTLQGVTTIRALRATARWLEDGEEIVERWQRAAMSAAAAAQWLALRLQALAVVIVGGAGLVAALQHHARLADAGLVGLAISYALSTTSMLGSVMSAFTETEREMIAVERIAEYVTGVEPESAAGEAPPYGWPSQGVVRFEDVGLRYRGRERARPALAGVSFETRPGEKLAVLGRTGAGKSSLMHALLRLHPCSAGRVLVDGVDVGSLRLAALRSHIGVIPQEPFVFAGSVRDNVDPLRRHSRPELWRALERAGARHAVDAHGGLDGAADRLSRGGMQLLCLARALLRRPKVLVLDEATASVDRDTERVLVEAIRAWCGSSTVITVAHRVHLALDASRVLVMGGGRVLELDAPHVLLDDPASHLSRLAHAASASDTDTKLLTPFLSNKPLFIYLFIYFIYLF